LLNTTIGLMLHLHANDCRIFLFDVVALHLLKCSMIVGLELHLHANDCYDIFDEKCRGCVAFAQMLNDSNCSDLDKRNCIIGKQF